MWLSPRPCEMYLQRAAAVDRNDVASHIGAGGTSQVYRQSCHFLFLAPAMHWDFSKIFSQGLSICDQVAGHLAGEVPGGDQVDVDVLVNQILGQQARELMYRLAWAIGVGLHADGVDPGDRADIDDVCRVVSAGIFADSLEGVAALTVVVSDS